MSPLDERYLDVDKYGVLKIPSLIWFALFFESRSWWFFLAGLVSPWIIENANFSISKASASFILVVEFPTVLLIYATFSRHPDGGLVARFIWSIGRAIIALAVLGNLVFLVMWLVQSEYWSRWPELFLASCGLLDAVVLINTWRSNFGKQVFREFPNKTGK